MFKLSARDVELEGHLDGNLCRCTGYKPILAAAKTFIVEDLKGEIVESNSDAKADAEVDNDGKDISYRSEVVTADVPEPSAISCGRPGGCCRDKPGGSGDCSGEMSSEEVSTDTTNSASEVMSSASSQSHEGETEIKGTGVKSEKRVKFDTSVKSDTGRLEHKLIPYIPSSELIFPPALWKFQKTPICYGNSKKIWISPTTLNQLIAIKDLEPTSKLIGGATEVQIEVRFKNSQFVACIYVSEIEELSDMYVPESEAELASMTELVVGSNTPLTELEYACKILYQKLGRRGLVFEACRKQLRYFAGRQIRNVASLAGNLATASPISDMNPVLVAAGATVMALSLHGSELPLPMDSFFISYRKTSLPPDSVITKIRIPIPPADVREVIKAYKQAKRKDDDIAIVTAAFRVRLNDNDEVENICLAYGGMAPLTIEARNTMKTLQSRKWIDPETLAIGLRALGEDFNLNFGVPGGMATYRKTLAMSMFFRFWHEVMKELELGEANEDIINEIHRGISSGTRNNTNPLEQRVVGKQIPHLSAMKQCTGEAEYLDDMPRQDRELYGAFVLSTRAHATFDIDWTPAIGPGLAIGYVDKHSISPELNMWGSVSKDEQFFAQRIVHLC